MLSNPHDAVFQWILGQPEHAASQLRAVLPPELVKRLDLDRLKLCPGSFIDEELRRRHSDLLFTVPLDGRDAFLYVLEEHQSSEDQLMAFRMLRYMVRIWDRYLKEHKNPKLLPAVVPIVVHQGDSPWKSPTELLDLIDLDSEAAEAVREFLPRLRFLLDDLALLDEREVRERRMTPQARMLYLLLQTAPKNPHMLNELRRWLADLDEVLRGPGGEKDFASLVMYILTASETPEGPLGDLFAELGPEAKEAFVTTADMLRAEGEAKGWVEGRAEGLTSGRAEALVQIMTIKFGPLEPSVRDAVRTASVEQIEVWTGRVVTAETLDDVLD